MVKIKKGQCLWSICFMLGTEGLSPLCEISSSNGVLCNIWIKCIILTTLKALTPIQMFLSILHSNHKQRLF
jgi:hypothetical protein